jgi:phosphatidylinositol alpha-mannosyltransferase
MTVANTSDGSDVRTDTEPKSLLRIGMICPYSLTVPGGVQTQVLGLARSLRARGHEVRVLGPCDGPPPAPFVTPIGNSLPTGINGSVAPVAPDIPAALRTIRALNDEAFDVLHVHEPLAPGPSQTALLVKIAPIVGTFHTAGDSRPYRLFTTYLSWLLERLDVRVAVSKDARELVERYFGGEYEVLFNGIEVGVHAPPAQNRRENAVFFLGRHEERKGLGVLLQALAHLPTDAVVWVGGDGPETAALREIHADDPRIQWLGRLSDEDKIDRLRRCAVFCAPSLHGESFGVVLLEAMAAGAPVVASALDGYMNVATHMSDALLVPPGDPVALASALARIVTDPRLSAALVREGHVTASRFSMDSLAVRYEAVYERALEAERAAGTTVSMPRLLRRFEGRLLRDGGRGRSGRQRWGRMGDDARDG